MMRLRRLRYAGLVVGSLILAFATRDLARDLLITPVAYLAWQAELLYWTIPGLVKWSLVIFMVGIAIIWQLIPEVRTRAPRRVDEPSGRGQVESVALWLAKSRDSNYFRWQVANRLGRISRRLEAFSGRRTAEQIASEEVRAYLSAGLDHSFADFPNSRFRFRRRSPTALDLRPCEAVEYLESQLESDDDRRTKSL